MTDVQGNGGNANSLPCKPADTLQLEDLIC
jgi:hypothetical protein